MSGGLVSLRAIYRTFFSLFLPRVTHPRCPSDECVLYDMDVPPFFKKNDLIELQFSAALVGVSLVGVSLGGRGCTELACAKLVGDLGGPRRDGSCMCSLTLSQG